MAMSRSFGGTSLITRELMEISPSSASSRPAIMRSSVDLPQPDGPTSTQNSPSAMSMSTPRMTWVPPKCFSIPLSCTDAMERAWELWEGLSAVVAARLEVSLRLAGRRVQRLLRWHLAGDRLQDAARDEFAHRVELG